MRANIENDYNINPNFDISFLESNLQFQSIPIFENTYLIYEPSLVRKILNHSDFTSRPIGWGNYEKLIKLLSFAEIELKGDVLFSDFAQHEKLRNILLKSYLKMSTKFDEVIAKVVKEHFAELEDHSSLCIVHQISIPLSEKIFSLDDIVITGM